MDATEYQLRQLIKELRERVEELERKVDEVIEQNHLTHYGG